MVETAYGVLLVEDDPLCRQRLVHAIKVQASLKVLAEAGSIREAMALRKKIIPDVLVVDIGLPDGSGIDLIRQCKAMHGETICLVMTIYGDKQHVFEALSAGAAGYLLKDAPLSELGEAILSAIEGDAPVSPSIAKSLLEHLRPIKGESTPDVDMQHMTPREEEILNYLALGFSRAEIVSKLEISINTVSIHIKHIYRKLQVNSGKKAVFKARQYGLLKSD